ncbi:hypothetical protein HDU81_005464 [Chytriomyces hyalinus]|nr:hypothetical protein HDU81_005464 [Chytriomyces hyalinus]
MHVVYTATHSKHCPTQELELGRLVPFKETPSRIDAILNALELFGAAFPIVEPVDHGMDAISRVHSGAYVHYLKNAYRQWVGRGGNPDGVFPDAFAVRTFANSKHQAQHLDENFPADGGPMGQPGYYCFDNTGIIVEGTYEAAYAAAQVALTAADLLLQSKQSVFALCRPPGHHAHSDLCGGYCFFNNAAIAVQYILDKQPQSRVAILDIDYHHGNGTQDIFYQQSNPLYTSIHGYPDYPMYWGSPAEKGEGPGMGFNVNVPLPIGTRDPEYLAALAALLEGPIQDYSPDIIVCSLGVDTFVDDVVGNFLLTSDCYTEMGRLIAKTGKPVLFVMEGGYDVLAIGRNVTNVLRGFEGTV